ncbi:glycosyltransferase family 2 protein [Cognatishimia sp. F0-27]|uniref:glycosyltransferase family 2 protein n=1 Tax=Cognatishimia sp. F0-27 TaxID=2816855 RepID=UPI001D0CA508|nr:glycosyltransferase family 2 protein [Cognatishimia sp. F0-27]MCC1494041.1 glycosyltransferase family 2 protein [Cognatishimia sp. F0-27]
MAAIEISVITPAYNCMAYLPDCVASVARQKDVSVEHIIVDDRSTDATARVMGELRSMHPHVRDFRLEQNIGQARVRNFGMSRAKGKYILFLDADDMLEGDTSLREILDSALANNADLVHFQYNRTTENQAHVVPANNALTGERLNGVSLHDTPKLLNNTSCWQMMYRHDFLDEEKLLFSHRLRQREDRPFFLECLLRAKSVNVVQTRVVRYRVRPDSTMRTLNLDQLALFNTHLEIVGELMDSLGEGEKAEALRRANLVYYMHVTLSYWAPFLMREDVRNTQAADDYVAAFGARGWRARDLFADRIMENIPLRHRDSGMLDVLAHFLSTGQKDEAFDLIRSSQMAPPSVERLGMTYRLQRRPDGFELTPEAFGQFASNIPLSPLPITSPRANRPKPKLILHAGATKTGSSVLQKYLEINRFRLLHDHGVYYPITGLENGRGARGMRTSGHATLIAELINDQTLLLNALDEELDQLTVVPQTVILSAENILSSRFWERGNVTGRLAAWLNEERFSDVTVLSLLRAPFDWLESMYGESIASPGLRLTQTPAEFKREQEAEGLLDFDLVGNAFQGGMPYANLVFRSYDTLRALDKDVVQEFFNATGLGEIEADSYDRPSGRFANRSISKPGLRMIRTANAIPLEREPAAQLNARIIALSDTMETEPAYFFDTEAATVIKDKYRANAEAFFAHHHPDFAPEHLKSVEGRKNIEDVPFAMTGPAFDEITAAIAQARAWKPEAADVRVEPPHEVDKRVPALFEAYIDALPMHERNAPGTAERIEAGRAILASGLFDGAYYLQQAPEALGHRGGPLMHYIETARRLLLDPNRNFSTRDYLIVNLDVAKSEINPFYHYVSFGKAEGRQLIAA